jgi:hypothetical protein
VTTYTYGFIELLTSLCEIIYVVFGLLFCFGVGYYLGSKAALIFKKDE